MPKVNCWLGISGYLKCFELSKILLISNNLHEIEFCSKLIRYVLINDENKLDLKYLLDWSMGLKTSTYFFSGLKNLLSSNLTNDKVCVSWKY